MLQIGALGLISGQGEERGGGAEQRHEQSSERYLVSDSGSVLLGHEDGLYVICEGWTERTLKTVAKLWKPLAFVPIRLTTHI